MVNEDRILFRFNTPERAEYRLWFTRRITLFILAATSQLLQKKLEKTHSTDAVKAIEEFQKQAINNVSNNQQDASKVFEAGTSFPVGADALLVMDVSCSLTKNGEKLAFIQDSADQQIDDAISIDFLLPGGASLNLKLSENLLRGMRALLDQLRVNAGWGEAVMTGSKKSDGDGEVELKSTNNISIH